MVEVDEHADGFQMRLLGDLAELGEGCVRHVDVEQQLFPFGGRARQRDLTIRL